jgi:hypothetical protein
VTRRCVIVVLALLASLLLAPATSGHRLKGSKAREVAKSVAKRASDRLDTAQLDDVTTAEVRIRRNRPCKRKGRQRVQCRILLRGLIHDPDLGDLPFRCYAREQVRYRGRRSRKIHKRATRQKCAGDLADLRADLLAAFKKALR